MKRLTLALCSTVIALFLFQGCASAPKASKSGFLKDYSGFEAGPAEGADLVYKKPGVDFSRYDKVMLDHVTFFFKDDAKYKGIHPDELKELADAFHQAMMDALHGAYPVVKGPGPDVLRIRVAVTDLVPGSPTLNTISTIIPIGLAISSVKRAATGVHANVGQASVEAEFLDSVTGERVAAALDRKVGGKAEFVDGMSKWGHVREAFQFWSGRLRWWLDDVHGKH